MFKTTRCCHPPCPTWQDVGIARAQNDKMQAPPVLRMTTCWHPRAQNDRCRVLVRAPNASTIIQSRNTDLRWRVRRNLWTTLSGHGSAVCSGATLVVLFNIFVPAILLLWWVAKSIFPSVMRWLLFYDALVQIEEIRKESSEFRYPRNHLANNSIHARCEISFRFCVDS